jgi:hypothetical protein
MMEIILDGGAGFASCSFTRRRDAKTAAEDHGARGAGSGRVNVYNRPRFVKKPLG